MKEKTLLIMAAGMGSRFGGLKQIEPVGPSGEFIIDYSIYDAIKAGFNKVVFVIKKENEELFKETVGNRVSRHIKVEYAFQDMDDLPEGYKRPVDREKPWGTSHAILSAKNLINDNFAIINADDFYGRDAYYVMSSFLDNDYSDNIYCVVGYLIKNTLSSVGSVKRGVCKESNGYLTELIESSVEKNGDVITEKEVTIQAGYIYHIDVNFNTEGAVADIVLQSDDDHYYDLSAGMELADGIHDYQYANC